MIPRPIQMINQGRQQKEREDADRPHRQAAGQIDQPHVKLVRPSCRWMICSCSRLSAGTGGGGGNVLDGNVPEAMI